MTESPWLARLLSTREFFPALLAEAPETRGSIDDALEAHLASLSFDNPSPPDHEIFEPDIFRVSENLADVANLLDRLLSYRREINALESERIRAGLSYVGALASAEADAQFELAQRRLVTKGFRQAVEGRRKVIEDTVRSLEREHGVRGSPLNFAERRSKLLSQMILDVETCYARSIAVLDGLEAIGKDFDLPLPGTGERRYAPFPECRTLDEWCAWHRQVLQALEMSEANEVQFEMTLPLGAQIDTWKLGGGSFLHPDIAAVASRERLALVADWRKHINACEPLTFTLTASNKLTSGVLPPHLGETPRLVSLGLTAMLPTAQQSDWRFTARVYPPQSGGVMLSDIGSMRDGPNWSSDASIFNRSAVGWWEIHLDSAVMNGGEGEARHLDPSNWPLTDLHLHLRMVGSPSRHSG